MRDTTSGDVGFEDLTPEFRLPMPVLRSIWQQVLYRPRVWTNAEVKTIMLYVQAVYGFYNRQHMIGVGYPYPVDEFDSPGNAAHEDWHLTCDPFPLVGLKSKRFENIFSVTEAGRRDVSG